METFGFYTKQCQSFLGFMNEVKRFKLTQVDDDSILHFLKKMPSNLKIMPSDEEITNIFTKYVLKRYIINFWQCLFFILLEIHIIKK